MDSKVCGSLLVMHNRHSTLCVHMCSANLIGNARTCLIVRSCGCRSWIIHLHQINYIIHLSLIAGRSIIRKNRLTLGRNDDVLMTRVADGITSTRTHCVCRHSIASCDVTYHNSWPIVERSAKQLVALYCSANMFGAGIWFISLLFFYCELCQLLTASTMQFRQ